jgi:hypothetical protein
MAAAGRNKGRMAINNIPPPKPIKAANKDVRQERINNRSSKVMAFSVCICLSMRQNIVSYNRGIASVVTDRYFKNGMT